MSKRKTQEQIDMILDRLADLLRRIPDGFKRLVAATKQEEKQREHSN